LSGHPDIMSERVQDNVRAHKSELILDSLRYVEVNVGLRRLQARGRPGQPSGISLSLGTGRPGVPEPGQQADLSTAAEPLAETGWMTKCVVRFPGVNIGCATE
jgi:hypothetical protein